MYFFHILFINPPDDFRIQLTALPGTTCDASSTERHEMACDNVFDDVISHGFWNEWASMGETDGLWITLTFPHPVHVTLAMIYFRCHNCCQFKNVEFQSIDQSTTITVNMYTI